MKLEIFLVAVVWVCLAHKALSLDNDGHLQDNTLQDLVAKLSEELVSIKGQLAEQNRQLVNLEEKVMTQADEKTDTINELAKQNEELRAEVNTIKHQSNSGPVFIRWGKKTCNGTNSELIYTGVAGGTASGTVNIGGSASLLCLSRNPSYGNRDDPYHFGTRIYGAQYQTDPDSNFPFETTDPFLDDNDIPCAVCEVTNGSSILTIPGTMTCSPDWRMEYRGYLMAPHQTDQTKNQFICVDEYAEVGFDGQANDYGAQFFPVEGFCVDTSLPCPPYVDNWEITCVVCSK